MVGEGILYPLEKVSEVEYDRGVESRCGLVWLKAHALGA